MSLEAIEARIKEITAAINQSVANHNALLARLSEAQHLLTVLSEAVNAVEVVADAL